MLNKIIILLLVVSLGCQSTLSVDNPPVVEANDVAEKIKPGQKDTIPPAKVRPDIMVDRARSAEQIQSKFPFDIPLEDSKRQVVSSDKLLATNGKPTVVMFWLTTCYPCRIEMKAIKEKYAQWQSEVDFNIVAISTDWDKHVERFAEMAETEGWPWKAYRDKDREFRKILPGGLNGLPQTFIFDKNDKIVYHSRKYRAGDEEKLFSAIKATNRS